MTTMVTMCNDVMCT